MFLPSDRSRPRAASLLSAREGAGRRRTRTGIGVARHLPGVGENLQDHLNTRFAYRCTRPITVNDALRGARWLRRIAAAEPMPALIAEELRPGADVRDDEALVEYIRATAETSWHPAGTCRMGSDEMAVVDPRLRVRGVAGLRIADASVMPHLVSPNPNAVAMMIGERGANLIRGDHGG